MTRTEMRDVLKRRLGNRGDVTTTMLDLYLDEGLFDLATKRVALASLEATASTITSGVGVGVYSRPTVDGQPVFVILHLEDTVNKRLLTRFEGGFQEYLAAKVNEQTDPNAVPSRFVEFGDKVYVLPTPQVATISWTPYVYKRPFLDTSGAAVPNIEREWHTAIIFFATAFGFRDLGDETRAMEAEALWDKWVAARDTQKRAQSRNTWPSSGAKPHGSWVNSRTGT